MDDLCCNPEHPLERDGTSQKARAARMLDPTRVQLDGRELRHMLQWATEFAKELVFYNAQNKVSGDWVSLVRNDPAVLIALISLYDHRAFLAEYRTLAALVQSGAGTEGEKLAAFKAQCGKLVELAALFHGWLAEAPPDLAVHAELRSAIRAELAPAIRRLKGYDVAATALHGAALGLDYDPLTERDDLWELSSAAAGSAAATLYRGDDFKERLLNASERVSALFATMHRILVRTVSEAPSLLENSLSWPYHQPHMALMLAFLKLFEKAQASLNGFTERHLKHYYEHVLMLARRPAVADAAHLVFTLAASQKKALTFKAGTEFKAGKDALGNELRYALAEDCVVNRASVADVRAFYTQVQDEMTTLHISAEAATADGAGEAFEDPEKIQWLPFGQDSGRSGPTLGLVMASPILRLGEGTRTITLTLGFSENATLPTLEAWNTLFSAEVSTETGWLRLNAPIVTLPENDEGAENSDQLVAITLKLDADMDPVAVFEAGSEHALYATKWPLLKLVADGGSAASDFEFLAGEPVASMVLAVEVAGMKSVLLETDLGGVAANKPFAAFGTAPKAGAQLLVGCHEAMQKNLSEVTLDFTWETIPEFSTHYAAYGEEITNAGVGVSLAFQSKQHEGGWHSQTVEDTVLLPANGTSSQLKVAAVDGWSRLPGLEPFTAFSHDMQRGFLRLALTQGLLHQKYLQVYTLAAVALAQGDSTSGGNDDGDAATTLPNPPVTPIATGVTFSYKASDTWNTAEIGADKNVGQIFHLHPFGHKEQQAGSFTLLPDFGTIGAPASSSGNGASTQLGALFIGLEDAPETETEFALSLLVQVAEGTEDPQLLTMPAVSWSYLAADGWVTLEPRVSVEDGTKGFITSGIITLKIDKDAARKHTILPSGYLWLRASVDRDPDGVCDLIAIRAQAAKAVFKDNNNAATHLETALPAGTIAKMVSKDARVSLIEQPFASFGGKGTEKDANFYTRVSERLRHKERAVSIWDYERLVLEHFPDVYKAKCISHATAAREIAPGNVAMVVIPNVQNKSGFDRIKPYASQALRGEIADMLRQRAPHAIAKRIQVLNPIYEEISTTFAVEYNDQIDDFGLASDQLRKDLVRFLSPWAFAEGRDIVFGNKIHASAIVDFIDERPYVDSIHDFVMQQTIMGEAQPVTEAVPQSARSILVAAPEASHTIRPRGAVA